MQNGFRGAQSAVEINLPDFGLFAQDGFDRKILVVKMQDRFDDVRERAVPYVVKKSGGAGTETQPYPPAAPAVCLLRYPF
jgi:hypothetical protein